MDFKDYSTREQRLGVGFEVEKYTGKQRIGLVVIALFALTFLALSALK